MKDMNFNNTMDYDYLNALLSSAKEKSPDVYTTVGWDHFILISISILKTSNQVYIFCNDNSYISNVEEYLGHIGSFVNKGNQLNWYEFTNDSYIVDYLRNFKKPNIEIHLIDKCEKEKLSKFFSAEIKFLVTNSNGAMMVVHDDEYIKFTYNINHDDHKYLINYLDTLIKSYHENR